MHTGWLRWVPVAAGGVLAMLAILLWQAGAPEATPYASGLAGLTLLLLGWPQPRGREAPHGQVASWLDLARDLGLGGPIVQPGGRMFLPARGGTPPPLDDGRCLHDGSDGYAAGVALANPLQPVLAAWLAADPSRLRDAGALEEDLNALAAWTGWVRNVRVLPAATGLRIRWDAGGGEALAVPECMTWLAAGAAAQVAGRAVRLSPGMPAEAVLEWVD